MRKFTTLFLLALAMTVGANQAFAQSNTNANAISQIDRPDRPDPRGNDGGEEADDDDNNDSLSPIIRRTASGCSQTAAAVVDCPPPRRRKLRRVVVEIKAEECGCQNKVMRVGGRFVTVLDCYYQSISALGREQLRYCPKDG